MLVMWSCLIQLLSKCPSEGCSSAVTEDNIETCEDGKITPKLYPAIMDFLGAAVHVKYRCDRGHDNYWSSSERVIFQQRKISKINIVQIVYIFLGGLQFQVFKVNSEY